MQIREIQGALNSKGFNVGEVDGAWGRRTIAAVRAFQQANGLKADGVIGPKTLAALAKGTSPAAAAPAAAVSPAAADATTPRVWFEEAQRLMGLHEVAGARSNPTILDWARDLGLDYKSDDIPWCGLFVSHCIGSTLPDEHLPNNPRAAHGLRCCSACCAR